MHSRTWGRFFFWVVGGLLYLAVGVLCIVDPVLATVALSSSLAPLSSPPGWCGPFLSRAASADHPRALIFLAAAVTILLGLIIFSRWPVDSVYVMGTLLGVDLLFHGVGWVSFGMGLRPPA